MGDNWCGTSVKFSSLTGVGSSVKFMGRVNGGNNWCGTSVEFYWIGVGTSVKFKMVRYRVEWGVGTKCLWCVMKVGCAMKGRGRFVRNVCGN